IDENLGANSKQKFDFVIKETVEKIDVSAVLGKEKDKDSLEREIIELEEVLFNKTKESKKKIEELVIENAELKSQVEILNKSDDSAKQESNQDEIVGNIEEYDRIVQEKEMLASELGQVKELNDHLLEKERSLNQELAKHRAQSLGLERMCEDFKIQIEELSKKQKKEE
ncbi:MAG: hypothetical protein P9X22_08315, partial [Candidatus Zapsychrus exili]|nr:hypothetical protein [Candidatus Zapsychrus exili]